jgi:FKBP-type peptidyl-prolyl cis-trans isomerase SlyD
LKDKAPWEDKMSNDVVADGKVVIFHYTLTNDAGEVIDSSNGGDPMPYLHGAGNIVPGLESQLTGLAVGTKTRVDVAPKDGYGEQEEGEKIAVPRVNFGEHADQVGPGMQVFAETEDGQQIPVWIVDADETSVYVSRNHPLAGETLHFDIEIVGIREANTDELTHGHPHGLDGTEGHHH